jgi:hypothetical protein
MLQSFVPTLAKYLLDLELTSFVNTLDSSAVIRSSFFHGNTSCTLELDVTRLTLMYLPQDQSISLRSLLILDDPPQLVLL